MKAQDFDKLIEKKDNIIFDFGGIFVDINYSDTVNKLSDLSATNDASNLYTKKKQVSFFNDFETGRITSSEFIANLRSSLGIESSNQEIIDAWNFMLKEISPQRVQYLKKISQTKKVFMLSNINQIHEDFLMKYIAERDEISDFFEIFDQVYFSHKIGHRKPNAEAYEYVIENNNLDIESTLFIDDSPQHVEGARKIGLEAILLDPPNTFITG